MHHKLGLLHAVSLTALVVGLSNVAAQAQTGVSFATGDLVVYRVGDGSAALTSAATAVFLDEYDPTGALVQSVALPTITSGSSFALTAGGTSTSEGNLNVSTNGQYLALTGYNAVVGTTGVSGTTSANDPRVVGIVGNGAIDTSTSLTAFSGNSIRAACTTDGSSIYAVGASTGVVYTTKGTVGTSTTVSNTVTNLRDVVVSNSQLYISSASGTTRIAAVGSGTPTTSGQTPTNLSGLSSSNVTSPYSFFFASLSSTNDTLYVADGTAIDKFSLVSGSYVSTGSITALTGPNAAVGLTGSVSNGVVTIYTTTSNTGTGGGTTTSILKAIDSSGYDGTASGTASTFATPATNEAVRGIAYLPNAIAFGITSSAMPEPGVLPLVAEAGALVLGFGLMRRRRNAA